MKNKKILITGGNGLLGSSLKKFFPNAIYLNSISGDLRNQASVQNILSTKPDVVIHCAAKVSGILENIERPAEHYYDNVMMNTMMMHEAHKVGVSRFINILSTCAYPDDESLTPYKETDILKGSPTPTNFAYGMAKRMAFIQTEAYNNQYGTNYQCLIPSNLFGIGDKYDHRSHFVGALIRKIHEAKETGANKITLFGTGKPLRQFLIASDFAKVIKMVVEKDVTETLNVAPDENQTIEYIARCALTACNAENLKIEWDNTKPDGQMNKAADNSKLKQLFPDLQFTPLLDGLKIAYNHYKANLI